MRNGFAGAVSAHKWNEYMNRPIPDVMTGYRAHIVFAGVERMVGMLGMLGMRVKG